MDGLAKNNAKTIFLVFLISLSIYQIGELWLRDVLSRNFFYTVFADRSTGTATDYFMTPSRMLINIGSLRFSTIYNPIGHEAKNTADSVLSALFSSGEFVQTHEDIDYFALLSNRSIVYQYRFNMPSVVFADFFAADEGFFSFLSFNSVVIIPSDVATNLIHVYFVDNYIMHEFRLISPLHNTLNVQIQNANREAGTLYYASSKLMGFTFEGNIFLPRWPGHTVLIQSMVESNIGERNISDFFSTPSSVWADERDGMFVYSDENQVLRFNTNNTVEYVNYRRSSENSSLAMDFGAAKRFIGRDTTVVNDIFLARITDMGDVRVFYFDYTINNFPILLSRGVRENTGLNHAIEVTVENGVVSRYRKIAYTFEVTPDFVVQRTDALTLINSIGDYNVQDIFFGYILNSSGEVNLDWLVTYVEQL